MKRVRSAFVLASIVVLCVFFQNYTNPEPVLSADVTELPTADFTPSKKNGKIIGGEKLSDAFNTQLLETLGFPKIDEELALALQNQLHVLKAREFEGMRKAGNLQLSYDDMEDVIEILLDRAGTNPWDISHYLEAHQSAGRDQRGNVMFTGYYTPVLKVRKHKSAKYRFPVYAYPDTWKGRLPSRSEIDGAGALDSLGLELAYASDPVDIYIMQLQGSGYVEYVDTKEQRLFRYAGQNGHRYRNIQYYFKGKEDLSISDLSFAGIKRFLKRHPELRDSVLFYNPSYTFFTSDVGLVKGAGDVPLMNEISIAADPDFYPPGSVLLAALPVVEDNTVTHHEYKVLLPQDVGGVINGGGHVDIYCGVGEMGRKRASALHHYGKIWILTPKKNALLAVR